MILIFYILYYLNYLYTNMKYSYREDPNYLPNYRGSKLQHERYNDLILMANLERMCVIEKNRLNHIQNEIKEIEVIDSLHEKEILSCKKDIYLLTQRKSPGMYTYYKKKLTLNKNYKSLLEEDSSEEEYISDQDSSEEDNSFNLEILFRDYE